MLTVGRIVLALLGGGLGALWRGPRRLRKAVL